MLWSNIPGLGSAEKYEPFFKEKRYLRLVLEDPDGPDMKKDIPLSFVKGKRRFALRRFQTDFMKEPPPPQLSGKAKEVV